MPNIVKVCLRLAEGPTEGCDQVMARLLIEKERCVNGRFRRRDGSSDGKIAD